MKMKLVIRTDSSTVRSIEQRGKLEKVRHIHTRELWLQEKIRNQEIEVAKEKGEENPAEALTKYLDVSRLGKHMRGVSAITKADRHELAPNVDPNAIGDTMEESKEEMEEEIEINRIMNEKSIEMATITTSSKWTRTRSRE